MSCLQEEKSCRAHAAFPSFHCRPVSVFFLSWDDCNAQREGACPCISAAAAVFFFFFHHCFSPFLHLLQRLKGATPLVFLFSPPPSPLLLSPHASTPRHMKKREVFFHGCCNSSHHLFCPPFSSPPFCASFFVASQRK